MTITTETSQEPIPGYRILERIGAGGYGEVWKAEAPGGLVKALKFVYGRLEEDRAARELKSLERIKDVRHPFLLSLERIEIADGRLIIVTELAEGSLKDRFDQCRTEGRCGIDREELLTYMRDAADVLDFMLERHSLQHLDIKPENLLLVGGRIKVADFGLVKKLQDVTASLLGGLTPLYAPPELFEGEPSSRSDQYSLAIVYLEMLTGTLPFAGRTAGQLAKQHLHAAPKLGAIAPAEQAVLRQALAKRPEDRFGSCREFVEALVRAPESGAVDEVPVGSSRSGSSLRTQAPPRSERLGNRASRSSVGAPRTHPGQPKRRVPKVGDAPCRDAGPIEITSHTAPLHPTIWVGLGGAGCRVVRHLREALGEQVGDIDRIPAWQFLMVDTDLNDLARTALPQHGSSCPVDPLLPIPLKRPQEYKSSANDPTRWLSRRWLYHIPKIPATNGLRPLGCLAFVDWQSEFESRLTEVLDYVCRPESIRESVEQSGLGAEDTPSPRIVLVAGLGGGTGGGILVEVARSVRDVLVANGKGGGCRGVLLHASPRDAQRRELAVVSGYATLVEVHHAQRRSGEQPLFSDLYLHWVGDSLPPADYEYGLREVAQQLSLQTTTALAHLTDKLAKSHRRTEPSRNCTLRACGAHAVGARQGALLENAARRLAGQLVESWLTGELPQPESTASIRERVTCTSASVSSTRCRSSAVPAAHEQAAAHWDEMGLNAAQTLTQVDQWCETALSEPVGEFLMRESVRLRPQTGTAESFREWIGEVRSLLIRLLGSDESDGETVLSSDPGLLAPVLLKRQHEHLEAKVAPVVARIVQAATDPECRVAGADAVLREVRQLLRQTADTLRRDLAQVETHLTRSQNTITHQCDDPGSGNLRAKSKNKSKSSEEDGPQTQVQQWVALRWESFRLRQAMALFAGADRLLSGAHDELVNISRELRIVHDSVSKPHGDQECGTDERPSNSYETAARRVIQERTVELLERLDRAVANNLEQHTDHGNWINALRDGAEGRTLLPECLLREALALVGEAVAQCDVITHAAPSDRTALADQLRDWFERAGTAAEQWGGTRHRYLLVPDPARVAPWLDAYYSTEHNLPTILSGRPAEVVFGVEVDDISITRAAVSLIEARSDRVEYAYRLLSRSDVEYEALPDDAVDA